MELLQLKYFYDTSIYENFTDTARKYMVPTTSVSASVKRLENELGCKLFSRFPNKIILNEKGKRLQKALRVVFNELDRAKHDISEEDLSIEIHLLVRAMRSVITDYIIEYKAKHPHIAFKTVFDFNETDFEKYDIIIDDEFEKYPKMKAFELCSKPLKLKVSAKNPLSKKKLKMEDLENEPFLSMGEQSSMHKILMKSCKNSGFIPDIVIHTNDVQCYKKCLLADIGIGIGRIDYGEHEGIVHLNISDFDARQTVYAYYKKQPVSRHIEDFIDFVRNKVKDE
ncbi:MAG: LysR family transcriptional regulator [Clostridia bacterium]|nr:LysR family transcriptional regulator [Clostridia bacterium]